MIGVDTNILLRRLIDDSVWPNDNPTQTAAVGALFDGETETFYVNSVVIAEALWILEKPMAQPKRVLIEVLDRMLQTSNLKIQDRGVVDAARSSYEKYKSGIHDRLIAESNMDAGCAWTATFDRSASKTPGFRLLQAKG